MSTSQTNAVGSGKFVVTDSNHNRVLIWNSIPTADTAPDLVLGQTNFTGISANGGSTTPTRSSLSHPAGVWTDGTRLVVDDEDNHRVLIWNTFPTSNNQPADIVLGQSDFTHNSANQGLGAPTAQTLKYPYDGVFVNGYQLFVADSHNGRVLIWNTWPTTNDQADMVLGQPKFVTRNIGPTQITLDNPDSLFLSGTRLIVGDSNDNRYMIFNGQ